VARSVLHPGNGRWSRELVYESVADLRGAALASAPEDIKSFVDDSRTAMGETDAALAQYPRDAALRGRKAHPG
jgi:hypothetical protein